MPTKLKPALLQAARLAVVLCLGGCIDPRDVQDSAPAAPEYAVVTDGQLYCVSHEWPIDESLAVPELQRILGHYTLCQHDPLRRGVVLHLLAAKGDAGSIRELDADARSSNLKSPSTE